MKLTVLSANLWLLPPPSTLDNKKRLEKFVALANDLKPDIINLQEVWLNGYKSYLKKHLKNYHLVSSKSIFLNKSGLVTFLKHRPILCEFHQFEITKKHSPLERVASKGLLRSQFYKAGRLFNVINTHIYETIDKEKIMIKQDQAEIVLNWALNHNPTIVAGDLNTNPAELEKFFENFVTEERLQETYSEENEYTQKLFNHLSNKNGVHYAKPDYVFLNLKSKKANIKTRAIKDPLVSDHYPLFAEIDMPDVRSLGAEIVYQANIFRRSRDFAKRLFRRKRN
jgi:endonuclease/exonuclease/phosphatase family metal-dependent hydrolase